MKNKKSGKKRKRFERIRIAEYLVSGGAYFWAGYLTFFIADKGLHWTLWWAKLSANVVGWIINYMLQRFWVFKNPMLAKHKIDVTKRYLIITGVDFIIDYLIVRELKVAGLTPYLGQFVSAGFFTFWNYAWYRWWVFPEKYPRPKRV